MSKIVILHFSPLELYPPIQNLLSVFGKSGSSEKITVITTDSAVPALKKIISPAANIRIIRFGLSGQNISRFKKYWTYFLFNAGSLVYLLLKKPGSLLYYETISSLPAHLYKKYVNTKVHLLIHYHEYTTIAEYAGGMKQTKLFHRFEKFLYPRSAWVSHTNEYRLQQFVADIAPVVIPNPKVLPNYPPKSWSKKGQDVIGKPVKVVYVGALSLQTMYVKEFIEFVTRQNGNMVFDIYSYNTDEETQKYLLLQSRELVKFRDVVNYDELPAVLSGYDVGVVLYKGHIENYIYNAPNKLFEYYACGLDVWFPQIMTGSLPYVTNNSYPKIMALDFEKLGVVELDKLINRGEAIYKQELFTCENVLEPLINNLVSND
jgi:hypothetical protein